MSDDTYLPAYLLTDSALAGKFAVFAMSERGQTILTRYGFVPITLP